MAYSSALNPNVVKTALDDVFFQEWDYDATQYGFVNSSSGLIFKQDSTDRAAEIEENFKGVSLWEQRAEEQDVPTDDPRITDQKTFSVLAYAKQVDIPKFFFDDNMHGAYEKMVRNMAEIGRVTQDDYNYSFWRNSFTTELTADGQAVVSDTHALIGGGTEDNKLTAALSEASLNAAIIRLQEMKDQAGVVRGNTPHCLLVPPALFKTACEIVDSEYRAETADNDINVYSSKYQIYVATNNRLGAVVDGSDTAWWLLGRNHGATRWVRQGITTDLVDYKYTRNNTYVYKAEFREVRGAMDYVGIVGSDGTT